MKNNISAIAQKMGKIMEKQSNNAYTFLGFYSPKKPECLKNKEQ